MDLSVVARCPHQNLCQKCFHFLVSANSKKASWRCEKETSVLLKTYFQFTNKNRFELSRWRFLLPVVDLPEFWPILEAKWLQGEVQNPCVWGNAQARSNKSESNWFESQFHQRILFRKISIEGYLHDLIVREILTVHVWNIIILCVC